MTYEIVDLEGGDVLGSYAEVASAVHRARVLVEESPELTDDIAVIAINGKGDRVGEPLHMSQLDAAESASPFGALA